MERLIQPLIGQRARDLAKRAIDRAPEGYEVDIGPPPRSKEMSDKMHAMCGDLRKQVLWCGAKLSTEDWKRVATAMLKKDKFIRDVGEDGRPGTGLIVIGASTRKMSDAAVGQIIEWLYWFGAQHNVTWGEPNRSANTELRR